MTSRLLRTAAAAAFLLTTFDAPATSCCQSAQPARPASRSMGTFGIDTAQMDTAVKPGDDFFTYVNGKWLATFKIPADKASYGAFDAARRQGRGGRADAARRARQDAAAGRLGAAEGRRPLRLVDGRRRDRGARHRAARRPTSTTIAAAASKPDMLRLMGRIDYTAPFGTYIIPDPADPTRYVVGITQSGLGMPVRDYYLNKGEKFDGYRAAYKTYVTQDLRADRRQGAGRERGAR